MKTNSLNIVLFILLFCFQLSNSQEKTPPNLIIKKDTIRKKRFVKDSIGSLKNDSIPKDSIKKPKESLEHIVTHNAEDYTIQNAKEKTVTLYNKAHIKYGDIDLKAGKIIVDYKNNTVFARGIYQKDSTGKKRYTQAPIFKQDKQESTQDSIKFNFKTKKALVYGVTTKQGEMYTYGQKTKRINDSTIYMRNIRFTTSNKKKPDYYISTDKAKLVPGKKIIVGASNLVIANVPTPLYLPFAYFPLQQKRTAGFIIPSWGENNSQGFFLQNGGYYLPISDYADIELTSDIYSNGSWALNLNSNYKVRYKFSGNLTFRYQQISNSIQGFSNYSKKSNYNISWNHNQDSKSSPHSKLSASVNLSGDGDFYRNSLNEIDNKNYLDNTFRSSINYYKNFVGSPFNINIGLTHEQNSKDEIVNMNLPSFTLGAKTLYPFQGKGGVKKTILQKIGVQYGMQGGIQVTTTNNNAFTAKMFRGARKGIKQFLNTSTNIKVLKYLTLNPRISYNEFWHFDRLRKRYDPNLKNKNKKGGIITDTISKFKRLYSYDGGVSLTTTMYGDFSFKGRVRKIRHTVIPSISWTYTPDLRSKYFEKVQKSNDPNNVITYFPFSTGSAGAPGSGVSNIVNISINNNVEAKIRNKDEDSEQEFRKITLLNNLKISTSYNFELDTIRWSKIGIGGTIPIIPNKLSLNVNGLLNPYELNKEGQQINKLNPKIISFEKVGVTTNFGLSDKDFRKNKPVKTTDQKRKNTNVYNTDINSTRIEEQQKKNTSEKKESKLYNSTIPWKINFDYTFDLNNDIYGTKVESVLGFSGSFSPTPKWKVGFRSSYDLIAGAFGYTSFNFARDLDSWKLNFDWIPFGERTSYTFFIGVKSSLLSDLKFDKQKPPDKRLY